jgi:hypothetical protein
MGYSNIKLKMFSAAKSFDAEVRLPDGTIKQVNLSLLEAK